VTSAGDFELNDAWDWGWDGTLTSDKTFLDRYDFDSRDLATSKLYLTGMADRSYFSAQALHFRSCRWPRQVQSHSPAHVNSEYTFDGAVLGGELSLI
jgi:LPS-assembly protein